MKVSLLFLHSECCFHILIYFSTLVYKYYTIFVFVFYVCVMGYEVKVEWEKVSDFDTVSDNPSAVNMIGLRKMAKKERKKEAILATNKETGATRDMEVDSEDEAYDFNGWEWKDNGRFTKLFRGVEGDMSLLGSVSMGVLMYIIGVMKNGKDVVRVDANLCAKKLGYKSKKSVYDGVFGLLKAEFIYRKSGLESDYFINVNKIFKGYRAKLKEVEDE